MLVHEAHALRGELQRQVLKRTAVLVRPPALRAFLLERRDALEQPVHRAGGAERFEWGCAATIARARGLVELLEEQRQELVAIKLRSAAAVGEAGRGPQRAH